MNIKERFAKYTTEELRQAATRLMDEALEYSEKTGEFMRAENYEFADMARKTYKEKMDLYLDVKYALDTRR